MKKCLIWGTGVNFKENYYLIKYYELKKEISVIGVTSNDCFYNSIYGYKFIEKRFITQYTFDYLIIMSTSPVTINSIRKETQEYGIPDIKLIPIKVMQLYGFDFEKYKKIKTDIPTIFAPNCWGGLLYNSMGLPFNSPLINMFVDHNDYIKFLKQPEYYLKCSLELSEMIYKEELQHYYPIVNCDDIKLYFNHYKTFEDAQNCWNRRKKRINWNNTIVMFYDENIQLINEFLKLPYKNKICFSPYFIKYENVI